MNNCDYYQELISRQIDGELNRVQRDALTEHLRGCDDCATVYKLFLGLSDEISAQLDEPPESLSYNIMAEIRRGQIKKKNKKQWKKLVAAAACAALFLAAAGTMIPDIVRRSASVALTAAPDVESVPEITQDTYTFGAGETDSEAAGRSADVSKNQPAALDPAASEPAADVQPAAAPSVEPAATANPNYFKKYGSAQVAQNTAQPAVPSVVPTTVPSAVYPESAPAIDSAVSGGMMMYSAPAGSGNTLLSAAPPIRVELTAKKSWTELLTLLGGKESKFDPLADDDKAADTVYHVVLMPDGKQEIALYIYGEELYYTVMDKVSPTESEPPSDSSTPPPLKYKLAKCTSADFLKHIEPFEEK